MKKIIAAVFSAFFLLVCPYANAQHLNVTITPPTNCVTPGTDVTYIGSHDSCTNQCTVYKWEISGGVFIIGGEPSSCTTLIIAEQECRIPGNNECTGIRSTQICGMPIVVRWNAPTTAVGSLPNYLKLTVTEKFYLQGTNTVLATFSPFITGVSQTNFNCSSATYSANVTCTDSGTILWNRLNANGTFSVVGTGATLTDIPNFDDVTYRVDLVNSAGITVQSVTRTFPGRRPQSIAGPSTMGTNQTATFTLNAPPLTANWSVNNLCSSVLTSSGSYADVRNNNCPPNSYLSVMVSGTWTCGTFALTKGVFISSWRSSSNAEKGVPNVEEHEADLYSEFLGTEDRSNNAITSTIPFEVKVLPVPARNGRISGNVKGQFESGQLRIIDITGREVFATNISSNAFDLDVPKLTAGTYIVQVSSANGRATQKIVLMD